MEPASTPSAEDPLAEMLARFEADGRYRVGEVLKETDVERTERAWRSDGTGTAETGPFIRKYIARESGLGEVYQLLFEAQAAGKRLAHVPCIIDCGPVADKLVVVMEQAPGETLATCMGACADTEARLELARQVFPDLCDAAQELHTAFEQPIIHRDITPSNIMVDLSGDENGAPTVTLIDFGISRVYKPQTDRDTAYLGTRPYAPPEQCGFGQTSVQTDVYALGAVLFFCLTGRAMSNRDRLDGYSDPAIPGDLRRVISKACALDARDRYASARQLRWAFVACPSAKAPHGAGVAASLSADHSCRHPGQGSAVTCTGNVPRPNPSLSFPGQAGAATPSPREPLAACRALLARLPEAIPLWVCRAWNAFITLTWAVYAAASWFTVAQALPEGTPFWLERCYAVFYVLLFSCIAHVLFDKRRLYARFGLKHDKSLGYQVIRCVLIILAAFATLFVIHVAYAVLSK